LATDSGAGPAGTAEARDGWNVTEGGERRWREKGSFDGRRPGPQGRIDALTIRAGVGSSVGGPKSGSIWRSTTWAVRVDRTFQAITRLLPFAAGALAFEATTADNGASGSDRSYLVGSTRPGQDRPTRWAAYYGGSAPKGGHRLASPRSSRSRELPPGIRVVQTRWFASRGADRTPI